MDKNFTIIVCSQCKNKSKNCRKIRRRTNKDGCTHIKCANYQRKDVKKTGEPIIDQIFTYRFLRSVRNENQISIDNWLFNLYVV